MFVLDTKYKILPRFEGKKDLRKVLVDNVSSSDIYQMLAYANLRGVSDVFLLYPLMRFEEIEPIAPIGIQGFGSNIIRIHFVRVPFIYESNTSQTEDNLKRVLKALFE